MSRGPARPPTGRLFFLFWLSVSTGTKLNVVNLLGHRCTWPPQQARNQWLGPGDIDAFPAFSLTDQPITVLSPGTDGACDRLVASVLYGRPDVYLATNVPWESCRHHARRYIPAEIEAACFHEKCLGIMFHFLFRYTGGISHVPGLVDAMLGTLPANGLRHAYLLRAGGTRIRYENASELQLTTFTDPGMVHGETIQHLVDTIGQCPRTTVPVVLASDSLLLKAIIAQRAPFPTLSGCTSPSHIQHRSAFSDNTIMRLFVDIELISRATHVWLIGGGFPSLPRFWHSYDIGFNSTALSPTMSRDQLCPPSE